MDKLSIKQLQDITGMSYPTALAFATEYGEQETNGGARARWFIPTIHVRQFVSQERRRVDEMVATLEMYESVKQASPATE